MSDFFSNIFNKNGGFFVGTKKAVVPPPADIQQQTTAAQDVKKDEVLKKSDEITKPDLPKPEPIEDKKEEKMEEKVEHKKEDIVDEKTTEVPTINVTPTSPMQDHIRAKLHSPKKPKRVSIRKC